MSTAFSKPATTVAEQIDLLKKRGLAADDRYLTDADKEQLKSQLTDRKNKVFVCYQRWPTAVIFQYSIQLIL